MGRGVGDGWGLVMNKNLSTPFKCAVRKWISLLLLAVSLDNLVGRGCPPSTDLFSSPEYAQFWVFGGTLCVSLATSRCHGLGFCVGLCVVSALNSEAVQSKACISTAKYEHSPFF